MEFRPLSISLFTSLHEFMIISQNYYCSKQSHIMYSHKHVAVRLLGRPKLLLRSGLEQTSSITIWPRSLAGGSAAYCATLYRHCSHLQLSALFTRLFLVDLIWNVVDGVRLPTFPSVSLVSLIAPSLSLISLSSFSFFHSLWCSGGYLANWLGTQSGVKTFK